MSAFDDATWECIGHQHCECWMTTVISWSVSTETWWWCFWRKNISLLLNQLDSSHPQPLDFGTSIYLYHLCHHPRPKLKSNTAVWCSTSCHGYTDCNSCDWSSQHHWLCVSISFPATYCDFNTDQSTQGYTEQRCLQTALVWLIAGNQSLPDGHQFVELICQNHQSGHRRVN